MSDIQIISLEPEPLNLFDKIYDYDDAGDFDKDDTYAGGEYRVWVSNATQRDLECQILIDNKPAWWELAKKRKTEDLELAEKFAVPAWNSKPLSFLLEDDKPKSKLLTLHVKTISNEGPDAEEPVIMPRQVKVGRGVIITNQFQIIRSEGVLDEEERWVPHRSLKDPRGTYDPNKSSGQPEDKEIVDVIFHEKEAVMKTSKPAILGKYTNDMRNEDDESKCTASTFNITKEISVETTETWEYTGGLALEAGTEFKAGLPMMLEGKIAIKASTTHSLKYGKTVKKTEKITIAHSGSIPPNRKKIIGAKFFYNTCDIPYTMKLKSGKTSEGLLRMQEYIEFEIEEKIEELFYDANN